MKGIAFFFEGEHDKWFCENVTYPEGRIRGDVQDGVWSMDYDLATGNVNVCIGMFGVINWDKPVNVIKTTKPPIQIPLDVPFVSYNEIMRIAKTKLESMQ
jgi:hypothetical protein